MNPVVQEGKVDGTEYQYYSRSADVRSSAQSVVVLVHGLGLNRQQWQHQIEPLLGMHDILTYDLLGHGGSEPGLLEPSLSSFSEQLNSLLQHLQIEHVDLVGFSLGGMIVRRFCMNYPAMVRRLVIMNSSHRRTQEAQQNIEARVLQSKTDGPSSTVEAALERWFTDQYRQQNPGTMNLIRSWVLANDADLYPLNYHVLASGVDEIVSIDPPLACPTLVMTSENDSGSPAEMAYAIADEINDARVVVVPDLKHMALFESPTLINKELCNFLDKQE